MQIASSIACHHVKHFGSGTRQHPGDGRWRWCARHQCAAPISAGRGLQLVDGGTLGFRLVGLVAACTACIIIDAAELGDAE